MEDDDDITDDDISICCSDELMRGVIYLDKESYDHVLELLRNPPPPTEALKKLMQRKR